MKVLISDYVWPSIEIEKEFFKKNFFDLEVSESQDDLMSKIHDADALLFCFADINESVLRRAKKLKVAQRYGIGVDNINLDVATELGIAVSNIPDYCIDEVSDHAMSMILALNRTLTPHSNMVKNGKWKEVAKSDRFYRLRDATLGIIGFGRIGRRLSKKAQGFGLNVIAYDPYIKDSQIDGVKMCSLDELLSISQMVSLHVPLNDETYHIIGKDQFELMPDDVILVNVSRGGLIDENILTDYLAQGKIKGVGLDVMEEEYPDANNPLFQFQNVIVTPHTAYFSQESNEELQIRACEQVFKVISGKKPDYLINPEVLKHNDVNLE